MMNPCEVVAERVAMGEPLGEVAEHAATCAKCRRIVALPTELGTMRRDVDPGLGFSARMTAGAQERFTVRRRRRIAGGLAAAVAATSLGVFVVTRESDKAAPVAENPNQNPVQPAVKMPEQPDPPDESDEDADAVDEDIATLVRFADTKRASKARARWARIQQPLQPYRQLIEGVEP